MHVSFEEPNADNNDMTVISLAVTKKAALINMIKIHAHNREIKHTFKQRYQKIQ